ncbi:MULTISPECIES: ABC transporter ATP-binding protein [Bacillaceae]|nr:MULTISPECIES: ABC transporter ATP-binding protein [Bacillaceae]
MCTPILTVENMNVSFELVNGNYKALENITFSVYPNEVVGIVGESGCGKSLTSQAILSVLPKNAILEYEKMEYKQVSLRGLRDKDWREIRGKDISMIFQEPMSALNPLITVGKQIAEVLKVHTSHSKDEIKKQTIEMMKKVGLPRAEELYKTYPHQLSGGMQQRVAIAIALIADPDLIIADEPTTALDVTIQAQILALLKKIKSEQKSSMIFISHDWGVIRNICDRVLVMYAGHIVEEGAVSEILKNPKHPYTKSLIQSIPDHRKRGMELFTIPGKVPSLQDRKIGVCPFADRCFHRFDACHIEMPMTKEIEGTHTVKCHLYTKGAGLTS